MKKIYRECGNCGRKWNTKEDACPGCGASNWIEKDDNVPEVLERIEEAQGYTTAAIRTTRDDVFALRDHVESEVRKATDAGWSNFMLTCCVFFVVCMMGLWLYFHGPGLLSASNAIMAGQTAIAVPAQLECPAPGECPVLVLPKPTPDMRDEAKAYREKAWELHRQMTGLLVELQSIAKVGENTPFETAQDKSLAIRSTLDGLQKTLVETWPPGPYDSSNPLLDAHARLLTAFISLNRVSEYFDNTLVWQQETALRNKIKPRTPDYGFWFDPGVHHSAPLNLAEAQKDLDFARLGLGISEFGQQ